MKKITSFFLVLVMALLLIPAATGFASFAESVTPSVDYSSGLLTVEGNIGEDAQKLVSIAVLKQGVTVETFTSVADLLIVDEITTESNGGYVYDDSVMPSTALSGEYTVLIAVEGKADVKSRTFFYATDVEISQAITAVNGMDLTTATAVFVDGTTPTTHARVFGVEVTGDYLDYTDATNKAMMKLRPESGYPAGDAAARAATVKVIRDDFKEALWIGTMSEAENVNTAELKAKSEAELIDLSDTDNYKTKDYVANKDTVWANFLTTRTGKTIDTKAVVQKAFDEAVAITVINASNREDLVDVIKNYDADVLKLAENYEEEMEFFEDNDLEVTKILSAKDYGTLKAFRAAFVEAVAEVKAELEDDDDDYTPSRGGSGGGGSSYITITPAAPVPEKTDYTKVYTDIKGHWAVDHISTLVEKGVLNGYGDSTIRPDGIITREEFLKMVIDALGYSKGSAATDLTDVNQTAWYAPYVNTAVALGISTGKGDGTFGIGETIKRQDMAVLACRALEKLGVSLKDGAAAFADNDSIDNYAMGSVAKLSSANIISGRGDGSFCPNDFATRAEAAKIICGVMSQREEAVK